MVKTNKQTNPETRIKTNENYRNYCTGDGNRNIQSCSSPTAAYNWAKTPNIVDLVPDLANSKVVTGIFYALFIMIFIAMGFSFIFWLMSIPICCTRHKRAWGYSMSTLCLINFLITFVCVILALVLILAGVRHITSASPDWNAHAGNALWLLIGTCVSNFIAMMCYSGGACCSRRSRTKEEDYYDTPVRDDEEKKKGWFSRFGRKKNKTQVDPVYKDNNYETANYNNLLPGTAQPIHGNSPYPASNQPTSMLQQPYVYNDPTTPVQQNVTGVTQHTTGYDATTSQDPNATAVPTHGYQTPILQPANPHE